MLPKLGTSQRLVFESESPMSTEARSSVYQSFQAEMSSSLLSPGEKPWRKDIFRASDKVFGCF